SPKLLSFSWSSLARICALHKVPGNLWHLQAGLWEFLRGCSYGNCCLGHHTRIAERVKKNIESYRMQETDGDCNIRAVVFLIKKKPSHAKQLTRCANPDDLWVQKLMKTVDVKMKKRGRGV
uniref:Chemokine (C-C motif) ligand 25b n=1 Tax=Gasterosteus aculeatus aculeatus TaxID=481459 RepID=G3PB64_GASAC